ncbi:MAG: 50S ribosomal protein L25/general stress protein Ctc [Xenococcaceae cyanobacterium MO_188.B29]|nr:50S ribosomal protein L25/general stress protein Ctc [Xenococcaceae cyanobacterium MO_188.B29]
MSITVECQKRPEGSKPRALRRQGLIPAALYGHNGAESVSLTMDTKDAQILLRNAAINNTLVDLKIPDISWSGKAIIREVQAHPWKRNLLHLSFFSVSAGETLELVVPVNIVGEAAGVKEGGVLEQVLTEFNISCIPSNIPESIDIDVSNFALGTNLTVGEVILPEGVTVIEDPERVVFSIVAPAKIATDTSEETEEQS